MVQNKNGKAKMKVLGIESSCDETAVAIVTDTKEILANLIFSQVDEHALYGGVVPEVAARSHMKHITALTKQAMLDANITDFSELDAVAVTAGPGLIGGVMVGAMMAKAIAAVHGLPIYAINHLEGHALMARMSNDVAFPYLLLLASGGHSQIIIVHDIGQYTCLGTTKDDAMGECFDKTAKLIGLGYPGGVMVEKMAAKCSDIDTAIKEFILPKPMLGRDNCDFSFSGLKTAVRRQVEIKQIENMSDEEKSMLCASFQHSVNLVVKDRLKNAIIQFRKIFPNMDSPSLVVSGGVAANKTLRQGLKEVATEHDFQFTAPPIELCTDNGVMIAWAGMERLLAKKPADKLDFAVVPRWPLESVV